MTTFILVIVLATSSRYDTGSTAVLAEFSSKARCEAAGDSLVKHATQRGSFVQTWGCFQK